MIFKIIIALIVLYILVELGLFYYRVKHLPKLPAISQTEKSLGQGPPLKYIAAGDSTAAGVGASSLEGTYGYKIAEYFSKTNSVDYKNIGVQGYKTSDV